MIKLKRSTSLYLREVASDLDWKECTACLRKFPELKVNSGLCDSSNACSHLENNIDFLRNLTMIEEILIARVHRVISLYKIGLFEIGLFEVKDALIRFEC